MEKYDCNAYDAAKKGKIGIKEKIGIVLKLVRTVKEMREAGVRHRDLKPQNMVIKGNGSSLEMKLIDFGIGRGTDQIEGTPGFSPVDLAGTTGCDYHSLAITFSFFFFELMDRSFWNAMFRPILNENDPYGPRKIFENGLKNNRFHKEAFGIILKFKNMKKFDKIKVNANSKLYLNHNLPPCFPEIL